MSQLIEQYLPLLEAIMRIKNTHDRRQVLQILLRDRKLKKVIREIALNVVEGNVPLTSSDRKLLQKYKSTIWKLKAKHSVQRIINQEGEGFLGILLPIIASLIGSSI